MVTLAELVAYSDGLLDAGTFEDYCPNGLQVEGRSEVRTLVSGVTASLALIEAALERGADLLLVHHGYFWKGEDPRLVGMKGRRLRRLIEGGVSLVAYHLPLDAHPVYGNNAQLGRMLGVTSHGPLAPAGRLALVHHGELDSAPTALADHLESVLGRRPLHVPGAAARLRRVAWCTGAAQGYLEAVAEQGVDAFITGEVSEQTVHVARELGVHFFAAGHHATERYGAKALGEHLAERFSLTHHFIDIDNPV